MIHFQLYSVIWLVTFAVIFLLIHYSRWNNPEIGEMDIPSRLTMELIETTAISSVISFVICISHWMLK